MTFQEIFNEPGLYKADSFLKGICFEVNKEGQLLIVTYKDANDLQPYRDNAIMYKKLFDKTYSKVYTRQSLFK